MSPCGPGSPSACSRVAPPLARRSRRMERDGLLVVEGDRHLELTRRGPARGDPGDAQAPPRRAPAGRRHRPRLGARPRGGVPLGARHERGASSAACSSCSATRPSRPTATPSQGLWSSASSSWARSSWTESSPLAAAACDEERRVLIRRISEEMQKDESLMSAMRRVVRSRTRRSPSWRPMRVSCSAPEARRRRSRPRRPSTSSCASSEGNMSGLTIEVTG